MYILSEKKNLLCLLYAPILFLNRYYHALKVPTYIIFIVLEVSCGCDKTAPSCKECGDNSEHCQGECALIVNDVNVGETCEGKKHALKQYD